MSSNGKLAPVFFVIALLLFTLPSTEAAVVTINTSSLEGLLGAGYAAETTFEIKTLGGEASFEAEVYSQCFSDGEGEYIYLYQVRNTTPSGYAPIEFFTLWPFTGADENTEIGYLDADIPTDFYETPVQVPHSSGVIEPLDTGPLITFYYNLLFDKAIDPGEYSVVMYVESQLEPNEIYGSVINGSSYTTTVVGPVPEPATMILLGLASLGMMGRRRRS